MAHQAGPLRLKGKLGNLSFYHNKQHGYLVRQKGGPDKGQLLTSPNFVRTRENTAEFSLAASVGKLIRQAVRSSTGLRGDSNISQRLTGLLVGIGKTDLSAARGMRSPATVFNETDSQKLLKSFAFYEDRSMASAYRGRIQCDIDSGSIILYTGTSVTLAQANELFQAPKGATHVRIKAAILSFDFNNNSYTVYQAPHYMLVLEDPLSAVNLDCAIEPSVMGSKIGVIAIEFLQEQNGDLYLLQEGVSLGLV